METPVKTDKEETPIIPTAPIQALPTPEEEAEVFCVIRKEKKIVLEVQDPSTKETKKIKCTLREMSGHERDEYLQKNQNRITDGNVTKFNNIQAELIACCLYGPDDKPIPEKAVATFSATVQDRLFKICSEMNALNQEGQDKAKKA